MGTEVGDKLRLISNAVAMPLLPCGFLETGLINFKNLYIFRIVEKFPISRW
jgi:hypothetical protein